MFIDLQNFYTDTMQWLNDDNTVRHVTCVKTRNTALMGLDYCSKRHKQLIDYR
jgi:hypothetical protein